MNSKKIWSCHGNNYYPAGVGATVKMIPAVYMSC